MSQTIEVKNKKIYIDGQERQIISGAIHYFRSMPEKWDYLFEKAKGFGLDAVETYIAWDQHEPEEGVYDFSGKNDLMRFIDLAWKHGLYVIVRPGPYICAEWTNGGLPPWLTTRPECRIRRDEPTYMTAVERFFKKLLPMLAEKLYTRGGPIIFSVIENEYGSYGSDKKYLEKLRKLHLDAGFDVPLWTADGGGDQYYTYGGMIPGCPTALTMGPDSCMKALALKDTLRPEDPAACMEFWCGAYDHWERPQHRGLDQQKILKHFEEMLSNGVSVNFYMFHGGTNFGFCNGANLVYDGPERKETRYWMTHTSYDYNAPLDESGETTELFWKLHEIMRKYRPELPLFKDSPRTKTIPAETAISACAPLFEHLSEVSYSQKSYFLIPMQEMDQYYGFQLCRCQVPGPCGDTFDAFVSAHQLADRAQVFFDGKYHSDLTRNHPGALNPVKLEKSAQLDVLIENQGYINFDAHAGEKYKGAKEILMGGGCNHFLTDWEIFALKMDDFSRLTFDEMQNPDYGTPAFYKAEVEISERKDTFLLFPGVKGFVVVNGFNIGRYWNVGPGNSLYVPAEILKEGKNEFLIFEQYQINGTLNFTDTRTW